MKKFVLELLGTMFVSLVAVPATFVGLGIGGRLWETKIDPWLNEVLKKSN